MSFNTTSEIIMETNHSNVNFSCLSDSVSNSNITNSTVWQLTEGESKIAGPIISAIVCVYFLISFCWNLFIIITYICKYHLLKEPANIFLFNLAIVDFLVTITNMLFVIISLASGEFIFGSTDQQRCRSCDGFGFLLILFFGVSLHTLAALSIDRFILLAQPLKYKAIVNKWKAVVILVFIWIISIIVALPPLVGFGQYEFNKRLGACLFRFGGDRGVLKNIYYGVFVVLEGLIQLIILLVTNVWTYKIVSSFLKRSLVRRRSFRETITGEQAEDSKHQKQQTQLIKVFAVLFLAHLFSWSFPVIIIILLAVQTVNIPSWVFYVGWLFYLSNPVSTPIIETFFVKDLRYQVRKVNKEVRRSIVSVGSAIYRASQLAFSPESLDRANQNMENNTDGTGEKEMARSKKPSNISIDESSFNASSFNASTATECVFVGTPTPDTPRRDSLQGGMPKKLERRITWSDQSYKEIDLSERKNGMNTVVEESEDKSESKK